MRKRSLTALAVASALAIAPFGTVGLTSGEAFASVHATTMTKLTYVYDFPGPDFELTPVVVAEAQGYFQKEHLSVNVKFPPDTSTTVKMLTTASGQIGFITTTDMAVAVNVGAPVVSIGNYSMKNNWAMFAKPGTKLSVSTLKGKKIFSYGDTWTEAMLPFVLRKAHLTDSEVKIITDPTGNDLTYLLQGRVNVSTSTTNYELAGFDTTKGLKGHLSELLGIDAGCPNIPIWVYATTKSYAQSHGATVKAFMAAIAGATKWAVAHPTQAAADFDKAYPNSGYTDAYNLEGWKLTIPLLTNAAGQYFTQTNSQWTTVATALKGIKLISSVPKPTTYYTNKFLP